LDALDVLVCRLETLAQSAGTGLEGTPTPAIFSSAVVNGDGLAAAWAGRSDVDGKGERNVLEALPLLGAEQAGEGAADGGSTR